MDYKKKTKPICESNDKHKEWQKNKLEDVKENFKIIKGGEEE